MTQYYIDLINKLSIDFKPKVIGMIIPKDVDLSKIKNKITAEFNFNNNGEKVKFLIFKN